MHRLRLRYYETELDIKTVVIREGDRAHRPGNAISNLLNNDSTYLTDNESTTATAIDKSHGEKTEDLTISYSGGERKVTGKCNL